MNTGFRLLLLLLSSLLAWSAPAWSAQFDYSLYQGLLTKYVYPQRQVKGITTNVVDYPALYRQKSNPNSAYRRLLAQLTNFNPQQISGRNEQIAFWINAYNIGAIKLILDYYPVDSIRSRKINLFASPWGKQVLRIGGQDHSLGQIEHHILLDGYQEPLIHFAIVCASLSCPDLRPQVYAGEKLYAQLTDQVRKFMADTAKGMRLERGKQRVYLSQIFKFDKARFEAQPEGVIGFILPFVQNAGDREFLKRREYSLRYLEYDWSLNYAKP